MSNTMDVDYLLKENRKLRMELKESKALVAQHRDAVIKLTEGGEGIVRVLSGLLRAGAAEGARERLRDEVLTLEGQVLVLEKIVNQTYENERETYMLLVEDYQKMQEENGKLENQLHSFYQKIGEVDYLAGLVTKYKEIVAPNQLAMAGKKEQEQLLDMLNLQRQQIKKLTDEKEKLMKINVHMKEEVERKKDEVKNMTMMILSDEKPEPVNSGTSMILGELDQDESRTGQNLSQLRANRTVLNASTTALNTTLNFVKLQRELIKEVDQDNIEEESEDSDELECPQLSVLFPDKVQQIRCSRQEAKVPFLNMKRVRELMAKREEKMKKEIEAEGHHVNPTNKIIQLETELDITRKELTSTMLKFRQMQDDNRKMLMQLTDLETQNQMLAKSNETLSNNYRNVYRDYQLCRSITNEVEHLLGRKISSEKEVIGAREELSTILLPNNCEGVEEDRVKKMVRGIFRDKPVPKRSLSPT